jgi:2-octaprenyl-6-methoxyphenol hydroxylase
MNKHYDVIIVGGGIVGTCLAIILARHSINVALVEALSHQSLAKLALSERTIVLSHSSRMVLESVGAWDDLQNHGCAINEIHVSDRGQFGTTRISAQEEQLPALGYVLPAGKIHSLLHAMACQQSGIDIIQPGRFVSFKRENDRSLVTVANEEQHQVLIGSLLVAADGQKSDIRSAQQIKTSGSDYQQTAIYCTITLKRSHNNIAYERFTNSGPIAFLPLNNQQSALVWAVEKKRADSLMLLDESDFLQTLQQHFGYRLGKFIGCAQRYCVDLALITAQQQIRPGMVLLGNAVHTLHPVAGQGLNLALRDVAVLAEEIVTAKKDHKNMGSISILRHYLTQRENDQRKIIALTHNLVSIFSNSLLPIAMVRSKGLILLDRLTGLKKIVTKRTSGLAGKVPRLVCGLDLEL